MQATIPTGIDVDDDDAILALSAVNPQWRLELSSEGRILISPLTGTRFGPKELAPALQLAAFARAAGGKAFGASAGFRMPDASLLGPDAAWLSPERIAALGDDKMAEAFWHVCPDVVVEVMSEWDTWRELTDKIDRYERNGAAYAIAIDPDARRTYERGTPPPGLRIDVAATYDA